MSDLYGKIYNTGAVSYDIFYRVKGSTGPFLNGGNVSATPSPALTTEFTIQDVAPNEYEFYYISHCSDGEISEPSDTFYSTPICQQPLGFNVIQSGNNFIISYTVPNSIGMVNLSIEYPNGGTFEQNYGVTTAGTITVPIPAGQFGNFVFYLRSVCNVVNGWYSPTTNAVELTTINPGSCPPPEITDYVVIDAAPSQITYRFTIGGGTTSVRVVVTNTTTNVQNFYTQPLVAGQFDLPLPRSSVDYNYSIAVFNLCSNATDNIGDIVNVLVGASTTTPLSVAGWTVQAGPDPVDVNQDGIYGTMVTVNTNTLSPSNTRTTRVQVRFNCSTSGYSYVNVNIAPGATSGVTRDWNSECTIDTQSAFINSAYLL